MTVLQQTLDAIGLETGTDKASVHHDYLRFYEKFFEKWRQKYINILEVGVLDGASLRAWERYFPHATIVGADIDQTVTRFENERIKIKILDQSNVQHLVNLGVEHGPFDIIIEDGSHFWEHQITTLRTLFPFLRDGGFYIVEDLQTNFGNAQSTYQGSSSISCVEYLKKLVDLRVAGDQLDIAAEEDPFLRTYGGTLEFLAFYRHACLLQKGEKKTQAARQVPMMSPLFTPDADEPQPFRITGHVGNVGDIGNDDGPWLVFDEGLKANIQGFTLAAVAGWAEDLRYRARLANGLWTGWASGNRFVGTTGRNQDLTGFAVALSGKLQGRYELDVGGLFRGDPNPTVVGGGQDCISPDLQALRGMQIMLRKK